MKFGQFEIVRWHPDTTPRHSIEAVMEKIEPIFTHYPGSSVGP